MARKEFFEDSPFSKSSVAHIASGIVDSSGNRLPGRERSPSPSCLSDFCCTGTIARAIYISLKEFPPELHLPVAAIFLDSIYLVEGKWAHLVTSESDRFKLGLINLVVPTLGYAFPTACLSVLLKFCGNIFALNKDKT